MAEPARGFVSRADALRVRCPSGAMLRPTSTSITHVFLFCYVHCFHMCIMCLLAMIFLALLFFLALFVRFLDDFSCFISSVSVRKTCVFFMNALAYRVLKIDTAFSHLRFSTFRPCPFCRSVSYALCDVHCLWHCVCIVIVL